MDSFDLLKRLISLITPRRLRYKEPITGNHKKLYDLIQKGKVQEANDVKKHLRFKAEKYSFELVGELKEKLLNWVFFLKNEGTPSKKAYWRCYKNYALARLLLTIFQRPIAITLIEDSLPVSEKFEFTTLNFEFSRLLALHYGSLIGNYKKFELYQEKAEKYFKWVRAEFIAEMAYTKISIHFAKRVAVKSDMIPIYEKQFKILEPYQSVDTYRFKVFYFNIKVSKIELEGDNEQMIIACDNALNAFKPTDPTSTRISFILFKIPAQIHLKRTDAIESIEAILTEERAFTRNWHLTLQYKVIWAFHYGKYEEILPVYELGFSKDIFPDKMIEESWKILEAYIHFAIQTGLIQTPNEYTFRIEKFVNDMPIFQEDKVGHNISILTLHVLFLLLKGDRGKSRIIDRAKSLSMYLNNHLKGRADVERSKLFVQMLLQLPRANFDRQDSEERAKPYFEQLKATPLNVTPQVKELEIVPYGVLWEVVLGVL